MALIAVFVLIAGLLFGSFYNVVIYRIPLNLSVAKGRSFCPKCNHQLKAIDLVPVFSQLFLKSKCRYCGAKISLRYPAIELITGVLFLLSYLLYGLTWECLIYIIFWSMLLITTMIDFDHMVISDAVLLVGTIPAVIYVLLADVSILDHGLGAVVGFAFFLLIYLLSKLIYKREAFGFGDVLLIGSIGIYLGLAQTILVCLLSFLVAAVAIVGMQIVGRKKMSGQMEVPFGPYICIAAFIATIFGEQIITSYLGLFNV